MSSCLRDVVVVVVSVASKANYDVSIYIARVFELPESTQAASSNDNAHDEYPLLFRMHACTHVCLVARLCDHVFTFNLVGTEDTQRCSKSVRVLVVCACLI